MIRKWFGKKQQSQIQRPSQFRKLAVESLEKREVLAGSVTIAFAGGNLYLTGDAAANSVNINVNGPNTVQITGNATTIINNTAGSFLVTGGVYATLNGGSDSVTVLGSGSLTGDLIINLGAGSGTVTRAAGGATTLRDLFVTTSAGNDVVSIDGLNARNINVNTGTGDTSITFDNTTTTGYANLINGTGAGGAQTVSVGATASTIGAGLLVSLGSGASSYSASLSNASVGGTTNIITGTGTGAASIALTSVVAGSSVFLTNGNNASNSITVGGTNTFGAGSNLRNGTATGTNYIGVDGVTAASTASHTFSNGAASTTNQISVAVGTANTLAGPVSISNTSAAGSFDLVQIGQGTFGSSLSVNNYTGSNINSTDIGFIGATSVGGILTVTNGASTSNNFINLRNLTTTGSSVTLSNGASGSNQANIGWGTAVSLAGTVNVLNGNATGSNSATLDGYTGAGNLFISNGTSTTTSVAIAGAASNSVAGNLTITNQSAATSHTVSLDNVSIGGSGGANIYNNGAGTNTVNIGTSAAVSVTGGLTYVDGTGDANVTLAQLAVGGVLNYFDSLGIDTLNIGSASGFSVGGVTNINTGAGADVVNIGVNAATFGGKLNVNLGADDDHLTIGANAALFGGPFANNFLFDGGAGTGDYWTISKTAIDGINPLTAATALQIYNFEGVPNPNTPTA